MTQARESKWKTIFSIIAVFTFGCSSPDLGQINLKTTNALQLVWQDEFETNGVLKSTAGAAAMRNDNATRLVPKTFELKMDTSN